MPSHIICNPITGKAHYEKHDSFCTAAIDAHIKYHFDYASRIVIYQKLVLVFGVFNIKISF